MDSVELEPAFRWVCPECMESNWVLSETKKPTEEELRQQFDIEPWQELPEEYQGEWYSYPDEVMCRGCQSVYKADDPNEE